MCFAYKIDKPFTQITFNVYDSVKKNNSNLNLRYRGIPDSEWHYDCIDLYTAFGKQFPSTSTMNFVKQLEILLIYFLI